MSREEIEQGVCACAQMNHRTEYLMCLLMWRRTQTFRRHAEQEAVRERGAPDIREARPDRGVHGAARPERPEQRLRLCDVRHQAGGHLSDKGLLRKYIQATSKQTQTTS